MVRVYEEGMSADRLTVCYNDTTYRADFATAAAVWHASLKNLRQHENPELRKFLYLWIDTNTSEIYLNRDDAQDSPELRQVLAKYGEAIKHDYDSFKREISPYQNRYPSWKTSFDNSYAKGVIQRANTPQELQEALIKGGNDNDEDRKDDNPEITHPNSYQPYSLAFRFHREWTGNGDSGKW